MNPTNGYRKPAPDAYADDDDLDLDLDELDPATSSAPRSARRQRDYGVPLRPLRYGGRRRAREDDGDDLEALVDGDEDGAKHSEEQEGLLPNDVGGGGARRLSLNPGDSRARRKGGLWRFLPFRTRGGGVALPTSLPTTTTNDEHHLAARIIPVASPPSPGSRYPANAISNAKYTPWSFLPRTLWNEFKFFFNLYFLLVALSQIVPVLRIGYLSTYVAPLAFVMAITLGKEALDDLRRRRRDAEADGEGYTVLRLDENGAVGNGKRTAGGRGKMGRAKRQGKGKRARGEERLADAEQEELETEGLDAPSASVTEIVKTSRELKVGDVLVLGKDQRLPADVVILKSFATESPPPSQPTSADTTNPVNHPSDPSLANSSIASATHLHLHHQAAAGLPLENATTSDDPSAGGEAFIRTDQLDGETDWKLRLASPLTQSLPAGEYARLRITAGAPDRRVNEFVGSIELLPKQPLRRGGAYDPPLPSTNGPNTGADADAEGKQTRSSPLTIDHTAWANTVLASSTTVHAVVIYTGSQTRAALSTSASRSKTGLLEHEINSLTKILCGLTALLSLVLVVLERFETAGPSGPASTDTSAVTAYAVAFTRFLILFSTIVPISLRVNLDMGKSVYANLIHRDVGMAGAVVRTSTIPEDLGRVGFLLTDKTGTLTRNEMVLRKVHVGGALFGGEEGVGEVGAVVQQVFASVGEDSGELWTPADGLSGQGMSRTRREIGGRVRDLVVALGVCHNVTPTLEEGEDGTTTTAYQASSPDEIAIVQWTAAVGLQLAHRDRRSISLQSTHSGRTVVKVEILHVFPFTSESKRMGIVVRFLRHARGKVVGDEEGEVVFFQKGADTVMAGIVAANDWLEEETGNMAREGLRTLVIGRRNLSGEQYAAFQTAYNAAALSLSNRDVGMARVVKQHLEHDLDLLGITGVEDKLQPNVKPSLELLRNAGIKIWMLTGDKVETARCIAISSKLVTRGQYIHTIANLTRKEAALDALSALHSHTNAALLIDGQSLALYLAHHRDAFIQLAVRLPAVIACRCTPTQKADLALLIRATTGIRTACIGDGGNDVSMIQAADIGIGIEGKEGRQASLAADFSLTTFSHVTKLLLWHGRNSYKRSAKLAQFVMHRGLIISVCQTVFSVASAYEPVALYRDWLLVGYATVYTMAPVFSLVLDRDVDEGLANLYPELYKELTAGKSLSYRTFFVWVGISVYQGLVIQGGSEVLVPEYWFGGGPVGGKGSTESVGFRRMVAVSYTALVVNEILMVACEVTTWHPAMVFSILGTAGVFFGSLPLLGGYFDLGYLLHLAFWWRTVAVVAASLIPVYAGKLIRRRVRPPSYRKVRGV
ncbi:putative aminophospholipid-translocase [Teratosphaeriaceae sp. CCFEE 6253]|nr:putative aminophospholipid-translocase [Teratosphaeriaceae sp. CCFEE 6253]